MNRTKIAKISIATMVVVAATLLTLNMRPNHVIADPQSAIYATFDAARAGNARLYLSHFTGSMEVTLRQTMSEVSENGFGSYLRDSNASLMGIAVSEPSRVDDREVKARVEFVHPDRTVAQTWYLAQDGSAWRVSRIENEQTIKTPFAYGTRVR